MEGEVGELRSAPRGSLSAGDGAQERGGDSR